MKTIGITGGIASGKSSVTEILNRFPCIEADQVSRELVAPETEGLRAIVAAFGPGVLRVDGSLDRPGLRARIAQSESDQQKLNAILHPRIRSEIQRRLDEFRRQGAPVALVSAALMIETGSFNAYDAVILVTAPFEERLARLKQRDGMDEVLARKLMLRQWPDDRKRPFATVVVANDGSLEDLRERTIAAMATLGVQVAGLDSRRG